MITEKDKEKIFDNVQHEAEMALSASRINVTELFKIKKELFLMVVNFIEKKVFFDLILDFFGNKDFNYVFCKSLRMNEGYAIYVKSEDTTLVKIDFKTSAIKDVFDYLKYINASLEISFSTELKGSNDIKYIYFNFDLNQSAEEIKNNSIYLKNKENNKLFTLKDYLENKEEVLEHLKLDDY